MKTIRRFLLSVLLSVFGFFVVHDYAIGSVDSDAQYELCHIYDSPGTLDLPSEIHEHIHVPMSIPETRNVLSPGLQSGARLCTALAAPHSFISSVQPRPPLS